MRGQRAQAHAATPDRNRERPSRAPSVTTEAAALVLSGAAAV
jgi:hypothetical protein